MMTTPEAQMTAARGRTFLHRTRTLLFLTGAFAVAYVAMTLLHAKFYQEAAENILDKKIAAQRQHEAGLPIKAAKQGDVLGRIEIPRLGVMIAILEGTSAQTLRLGAGHIKGTAFPGEPGNSGIAGHRDTFFRPLRHIERNDLITLTTMSGEYRYRVLSTSVVGPDDVAVLEPGGNEILTLVTCYPFYFVGPAPNRFIVRAERVA